MLVEPWMPALGLCLCCLTVNLYAQDLQTFPLPAERGEIPYWDMDVLGQPPQVYEADVPELTSDPGIHPVYFEGLPWKGKPTRVFAWLGVPPSVEGPVPGIVLVHGGGGTAFHDWVKLWMDRGYAAIAIDTTGCVPTSTDGMNVGHRRHEHAGPGFGGGGFTAALSPVEDQWLYHAVADVMLARSLLAAQPDVDPERIGITGISWGGIITEITVGVDNRYCFAVPVYGCGHLGENSYWLETDFQKISPAPVRRWITLWDPAQYVGQAEMPLLFCNGTNDKHFRPDSWQKTYREVPGEVTLSMKIRMPHDHPPAGDPPEIRVFADSIVHGEPGLAIVTDQGQSGALAWVEWEQEVPVQSAELVYTTDTGNWVTREWRSVPARLTSFGHRAEVAIPSGTTACFFNLKDERGCIVSSGHFEPDS